MSKRQKKIDKVMGEFKRGSLKSGGSGKKVTNPKQAIAIALSEANAMNEGGMMKNPVMQRPMFQTPMQREGMGIMAGVAPVRGFAFGGEAEEEPGFMDFVSSIPRGIGDAIVGEDGTMDDFFTLEQTPEGQGLNLRDLTNLLIVNPDDPADVALATATAGLMATGVGAPGAIAAKLANIGFKGKKVAEKIERAIRRTAGETKLQTFKRGQTGRLLLPGEAQAADLQQISQAEGEQGGGGIENLPEASLVSGTPTAEELENIGMTAEKFQSLDPAVRQQYIDVINDRRGLSQIGDSVLLPTATAADLVALPFRGIGQLYDEFSTSRVGRALGMSEPGEETEDFEPVPYSGSLRASIEENKPITEEGLVAALTDKPDAPVPIDSVVVTPESQLIVDEDDRADERSGIQKLLEGLGSDRVAYQFAKAAQPSAGAVPRNLASDLILAGQEYDRLQKDDTALQSNLAALQELMPESSPEDLINLLMGRDPGAKLRSDRLSLFKVIAGDPSRGFVDLEDGSQRPKTQEEIFAEVDNIIAASEGQTSVASDIPSITTEEMERYS